MEYKLKCGASEAVVSSRGGEMTAFRQNGKNLLWTGNTEFWPGHAPVLFPFVSALTEKKVRFDDAEYSFADKHGFARKLEYTPERITDTEAVFLLVSNEVTRAEYPYGFELRVIHKLNEDGFSTHFEVTNADRKPIVFCIGGHPGFCLEGDISEYVLRFSQKEDAEFYYTDAESRISEKYLSGKRMDNTDRLVLNYADFKRDALILRDPHSTSVVLRRRTGEGTGIEFSFGDFPVLVLWTPPDKNAPFLCLEPWYGLPAFVGESGRFEDKPYCITLDPGKKKKLGYSVKVI